MGEEERRRWDGRYASGDYVGRPQPTPFLEAWLPRIPVGRALDVATGTGRNALRLAEAGFTVDAIDISEVAIAKARAEADRRGLDVDWTVADLETHGLPVGTYDLVVVARYRDPALWPRLVGALAPDGWIVVEHHLRTPLDVAGPPTDTFRLEPGELLRAFGDLRVLHYSEQLEEADDPTQRYAIARLVACAGDPGF